MAKSFQGECCKAFFWEQHSNETKKTVQVWNAIIPAETFGTLPSKRNAMEWLDIVCWFIFSESSINSTVRATWGLGVYCKHSICSPQRILRETHIAMEHPPFTRKKREKCSSQLYEFTGWFMDASDSNTTITTHHNVSQRGEGACGT